MPTIVDLFNDIVQEKSQHHNYKAIKNDNYKKNVINLWADDKIIKRDKGDKFIKEFQTEFNSSFWELYIYQCLKTIGCNIDLKYEYPDYVVTYGGQDFVIECTIANNAKGKLPEYDINAKLNNQKSSDEMVYHQILRLSNSFDSKYNKYKKNYSGKDWVKGKPYIVAIAPFEQPNGFSVGNEAILATLYGKLFERTGSYFDNINGVIKENNSEISLGYFNNSQYKEVTAVLFSSLATIGKVDAVGDDPSCAFIYSKTNKDVNMPLVQVTIRTELTEEKKELYREIYREIYGDNIKIEFAFYREKITDGLYLYLNPFAEHELDRKVILNMYNAGISICNYSLKDKEFDQSLMHDNFLVHRLVNKFSEK